MTTKVIHEANLAEVNQLGDNSAEFVIRPLFYGYGNTLGNSIRRVLLSSIKGAAIPPSALKVPIMNMLLFLASREDVVDIMLNLKNIRLKSHSDEPVEIAFEFKGKDAGEDGKVLAGDIKLPADVEIGNPEQIICHIDDPNFVLKMNFVVETGRGYLPIDKASADRLHSDMIALDAVLVQFFAYASRSKIHALAKTPTCNSSPSPSILMAPSHQERHSKKQTPFSLINILL